MFFVFMTFWFDSFVENMLSKPKIMTFASISSFTFPFVHFHIRVREYASETNIWHMHCNEFIVGMCTNEHTYTLDKDPVIIQIVTRDTLGA